MLADFGDDLSRPRRRQAVPSTPRERPQLRVAGLAVAAGLLALAATGLSPSTPDVTTTASTRTSPAR
jgi:hypothetical protein